MFGSRDDVLYFSKDQVISARFSMIDFTKELILRTATRVFNRITYQSEINNEPQTQYFTESEKLKIVQNMHSVMMFMKRNVLFDELVCNLVKKQQFKKFVATKKLV